MAASSEKTHLEILDPTVASTPVLRTQPGRLGDIRGTTVGLLDNGKANAGDFLRRVGGVLHDRYAAEAVIIVRKDDASTSAPSDVLNHLIRNANFIVAGVGD